MDFPSWSFYFFGGVYALAFYLCSRVLFDRRAPSATIGWILILLGAPLLGIPLYLLVGQSRLRGYIKRKKRRNQRFEAFAKAFETRLRATFSPPRQPPEAQLVLFQRFQKLFSRLGPICEPYYNSISLLDDNQKAFQQIFSAIEAAQTYIFVQYYILRSDRLGLELKELLLNKARRGIPVYVLVDDMGSFWLSKDYISDLKNAGIKVVSFLPMTKLRRGVQVNFRNHRKLVVVDGRVAFTGGLNVGDEYAGRSKDDYWRDTHLMIQGPAVAQLEEIFFEDWFFAADQRIAVKSIMRLAEAALASQSTPPPPFSGIPSHHAIVQVIPSGPADDWFTNILLFTELINSSRSRLWIASPYFVPDATLERALELAILRGVDVRIMIPKVSDHPVVQWVSFHHANQMKRRGADVYLYRRGFMHQKVLLVDNVLSCIGTTNFDNRAMYLNFETSLVIHDEKFNSDVAAMLVGDFGASLRLQQEDLEEEKLLVKLRGNVARLLSPLL